MEELKKGLCIQCREIRILNSKNICCFCDNPREKGGIEIKSIVNGNIKGKEIESKTGSIKTGYCDNAWMSQGSKPI